MRRSNDLCFGLRRRLLVVGAAGALAWPASAVARPVLTEPVKPCYVAASDERREPVLLAGSGFTPGSLVAVEVDGEVVNSGVSVDPDGNLPKGSVDPPFVRRGDKAFVVRLAEVDNPEQSVSAESRVTSLGVSVTPRRAAASTRVTFRGRGFTRSTAVYAHYVKSGRSHKTVRLAAPKRPCGTFRVRRRQFPFDPTPGRWTLQIDQQRRYSSRPRTNFVRRRIAVRG